MENILHLITGGSGFLGDMIARRLVNQGEGVIVADIWRDDTQPESVKFLHCDITDRKAVSKAMQGVDVVHHNAALVPLTKSGHDFARVNTEGSRIVAEEAKKNKVKFFIHMSSSSLYGIPEDHPITELTPLKPVEIYGKSKLAGEIAVRECLKGTDTQLIVIRPRTILGHNRLGIFHILFQWIQENRKIYIIGDGNNPFQFIHVDDLMDAYMLAMKAQRPGTYNVGTPYYGSLREALENVIQYAHSSSKVVGLPVWITVNTLKLLDILNLSPLAPFHYLSYHKPFCFDVSKLLELGWKPKYSNDDMLEETYKFFVDWSKRKNNNMVSSVHRKKVNQKFLNIIKRFS